MKFKPLGNTDLQVSLICLGTMTWGEQNTENEAFEQMDYSMEKGVNFFDTAEYYSVKGKEKTYGATEKIIGNWFKQKNNREKVILASKVAGPDVRWIRGGGLQFNEKHFTEALEGSLQRLQTDYIDLYQLHQPDPLTPLDETMQALDDLVTQGKIRYIGCSNLPSWQVVESQWISKSMGLNRFVSCQDEYNILNRNVEAELIPAMQKYGCGLLPYFPLASGLLTGKYKRTEMPEGARLTDMPTFANRIYLTDENFDIVDNLNKFAHKTGHSILELAFGWMASRPTTASIIAGATKPEQIDANVAAVNWVLSQSEIDEVNKISAR